MKKQSRAPGASDGRDLAAVLTPQRDTILSQLAQAWRMRAPKSTVMLGAPQRAVEVAESIGAAWFMWLENVNDLSAVRAPAIDLVGQGLTYTMASTLVQLLAAIVTDLVAKDAQHEVTALKLTRQFSAAFLDQIATQHELHTRQEQEHLAVQLQASAEVGRAAASILDTDQLLREAVNLITDRFGFYYTAVFTLDHTGQYAVLREATGQAGEVLKNLNHKLEIHSQSMVGAAITSRRPQVAAEVGQDVPRFSNPLLPDTQSEIALPLSVGDRVLGALDVQSTEPRAFEGTNVTVLQNMADQIAIALENARLFERAQANLKESQTAQADLAHNQAQLADALRVARLGNWSYDVPTDTFTFNDQFYTLMRTTAEREGGYTMSSAQYTQRFVHPDDAPLVGAEIVKALETTDPNYRVQLDHRVYFGDGELGYITVRFTIEKDAQGRTIKTRGANQDITERQRSQEQLQLLTSAVEAAAAGIAITDRNGKIEWINPGFTHLTGYTFEEATGQNPRVLKSGKMSPEFYRGMWQTISAGQVWHGELINRRKDGTDYFEEMTITPVRSRGDEIMHYIALKQDVTERKAAEEALRRSEAQLYDALRVARLGNWSYDVPTDTFTFNDQFYTLMRTTAEREGGYTMSSAQYTQRFVHPDDAPLVGAEIVKALETTDPNYRVQLDHRVYFGDGELGYITVRFTIEKDAQGRTIETHGANQDITERKLAEASIKETEERFRIIAETTPIPILISAVADGTVLYGNDQLGHMFGIPIEQLIGRPTPDFYFDPAERQTLLTRLRQAGSLHDYELHVKRADDTPFWVLVSMRTLVFAGQPALFAGFLDITASRQAAEELRNSQAELSEALKIAKLAYWEYDVEKDLFQFNDQFYSIFHTTAEQHGGYQLSSAYYAQRFVYPDDLPIVGAEIEKALTSTDRHYSRQIDHRIQYADNGVGYISVSINIDRNEQGQILRYYGANQDITETKLAAAEREQLLAEQQKHTLQLQAAAEISRVATSILSPDQLLNKIVELIATRFDFYHVAAYTIDESGRWAVLREATGEVGQQLKDRSQALAIRGQSIVGHAIRNRQPRIALDVGPDAVKFDEPLLPDTHSEIALPLFIGDQVLGALDVYSVVPAAFDDNFAVLLQAMADQIAVALNTAEQYQREQAHVEQTNRLMQIVIDLSERTDRAGLQNRLVRSALKLLETDRAQFWLKDVGGLELTAAQSVRPGADQSLAISQELANRVGDSGLPLRLDSPPLQAGYASRITDVPFNAALLVPISWQGQTIGVLSVMRSQPGRPFTQDDENAAQLLAAQAAAALENIALSEQQQHRAVQLQTAAEVSRASSTILQLEELLNTVVELVRDNFNLYYVGTFLLDEQAEWAYLRAGTGEAGRKMLQARHRLRVDESSMIGWSIVHRQARIALDVGTEAAHFDNPLLPNTRSEMALPLISRGHIIGAATIQSTQPAAFTTDDITILQTMADQITTAVENARLFERAQQSVQHMTTLNEIMRAISQEIELEWVLDSAYHGVQRLLPVDTYIVALYDRATDRVSYPLIADEGQSRSESAGPIDPDSPIGRVIRSAEPMLENVSREDWAAIVSGQPYDAARPFASRLVVPLLQGNQTIGALSVQTYEFDAYTREQIELLQNVASQLSVAVVNAQLLEQTRQTADELNALNRRLTGEAWQSYVQTRSPEAVIWHASDPALSQAGSAQAELLAAGKIAVQRVADEADISVPVLLRGQLIGALRFRAPADKWTDEAQAIATSIAGHLAQSAENIRLIEQTQQTAQREKLIAQAADNIHRASDLDAILQTAVQEIARITGSTDVGIQLGAPSTFEREHRSPDQPNGRGAATESDHVLTLA